MQTSSSAASEARRWSELSPSDHYHHGKPRSVSCVFESSSDYFSPDSISGRTVGFSNEKVEKLPVSAVTILITDHAVQTNRRRNRLFRVY